ncbi:hypothetical protein RN001_011006 [Aquatica leii]|uniref:Bleomycin hydrolase n=1 Tax=Aquatica leii TaxID=1421715 RepID=A0AAN7P1S1_9COLE|nr:hypothetical protein RN001_011006 [Aquatica leii]
MSLVINKDQLKKFRTSFEADNKNQLAQNVCSRFDPFDVCISRKRLQDTRHVFKYKIEHEGKPVTNQKSSGRCWLFAALNVMRINFIKAFNLEEFEFSQGYLFFWDKVERCNFFLNTFADAVRRNEEIDGRLLSFLLKDLIGDGGQWDMLVNVINKYGVMPKQAFPESFSCESSAKMNQILRSKLREYAKEIYEIVKDDASDEKVKNLIEVQMITLYRIIGICLGIPDDVFSWNYYDKNKTYHSIGPITPLEFYNVHVKPVFNVDDKVCIVTDPRPTNPYENVYTVDCLGNMVGGRRCIYNNQPVELLIDLAAKSIKNGEAVWFGCDVTKRFNSKYGIEDLHVHDFSLLFGTEIQIPMSKADRLLYGESAMTHAMVFTAVSTDDADHVTQFRVENSWGDDKGDKGYLVMTAEWFTDFGYEVVIDKKFVPQHVLDVFNQEPIVLPAWDPMGTLAL